jgi:accessory colonization factor AcfC
MLEIFTHNAGYQVKIFTDYDEARVWLTWETI